MPSTITAPAPSSEPPLAATPLIGAVVAHGIEVPQQSPVGRRERAQMAVDRAREHGVRRRGHRARLRRAAARARRRARRARREPDAVAVRNVERREAAALDGVELRGADRRRAAHVLQAHDVRDCRIDVAAVARGAPLDAAVGSAFADAGLPQRFAAVGRIERVHDAGFLARDEDVRAARRAAPTSPRSRSRGPVRRPRDSSRRGCRTTEL